MFWSTLSACYLLTKKKIEQVLSVIYWNVFTDKFKGLSLLNFDDVLKTKASRMVWPSVITLSKFSWQHLVFEQSWWMEDFVGQLTLVCPCIRVHRRMSLMCEFLPPHQCSACLAWMVYEMGGKWLYNCCFVGCCLQDLFITACSILV